MKKLIFILFLFTGTLQAQNIVSLSFQPVDLGYGLRYDRVFNHFGLYASASRGSYKLNDDNYLKDHYKFSIGGSIPFEYSLLSLGLSYNRYGERSEGINVKALRSLSFDVGCGAYLGRVFIAMRMDLIKGESTVDIGLKF